MRLLALVSVVALALIAPGCQQEAEKPKEPEAKTFKFIAVLSDGQVKAGVESAKNKASNCEVLFTKTAQEQVDLLKKFAAGGVDGIAIECIPSPEVSAAVKECYEKGVPVVTFGGDCVVPDASPITPQGLAARPATGRHATIGTFPADIGMTLANRLTEQMTGKPGQYAGNKVAIISFDHPSIRPIEDAVVTYLQAGTGLTVREPVRVAGTESAIADAVKAAAADGIGGWIILNPAAAVNKAAALAGASQSAVVALAVQPEDINNYLLSDRIQKTVNVQVVLVPYLIYGQMAVQMLDGITRDHQNYADVYSVPLSVVDTTNRDEVVARFTALADAAAKPSGAYPAIPGGRLKDTKPQPKEQAPATPAPAEQPKVDPVAGGGDKPAEPASN
jgi:ABC-type sugar transport system substrate-binding protein